MLYSQMFFIKACSSLDGHVTMQQIVDEFRGFAAEFDAMAKDGVTTDPYNPPDGGHILLITEDETVAARYGFEAEWDEDEEEHLDGGSLDSQLDSQT